MLKAEFHTHVKGDPQDNIKYTAEALIDRAAELQFDVLAITCHDYVFQKPNIEKYAQERGILLLLGIERTIEGKHTLLYNCTPELAESITSFTALQNARKENPGLFVIAPHPFMGLSSCLKKIIRQQPELFDAWEVSFFSFRWLDLNKKVKRLAKEYQKPLVGNSDVHHLEDLGKTYTLIDAPKNRAAVIAAVKSGKTEVCHTPLSMKKLLSILFAVCKAKLFG